MPPDQPDSWKVYVICTGREERLSTTRADVDACESEADRIAMRTSFTTLLARAVTGRPLEDMWDKKKCHEAHTFTHSHATHRIFRIWGTGKIRVYFMYLDAKRIVLIKSKAKRVDKLSTGELKELEDIAKDVLNLLKETKFESRVIP